MMRPVNFPVVSLFHVLGVHLTVRLWKATQPSIMAAAAAASSSSAAAPMMMSTLALLKHPSMMMVLLSLLLVTSTSMITNDYYDARGGVDTDKHPLVSGSLSYNIAKTFDSVLYAALLLSSAFVPGVVPRLAVLSGAIVTYLYTVHLKPKTFIKNYSCAALVALSPVTSGLAAREVLNSSLLSYYATSGAGSSNLTNTNIPDWRILAASPLSFLVVALFAGITSREILMDITDRESDGNAGIRTIPVRYGTAAAAKAALGWSALSGLAACALPLRDGMPILLKQFARCWGSTDAVLHAWDNGVNGISTPISSIPPLGAILTATIVRRLVLSAVGSAMLLYRAYLVVRTRGEDVDLAQKAVDSSLLSVLLVLASFV